MRGRLRKVPLARRKSNQSFAGERRGSREVEYTDRTHQTLKIEGFGGFDPSATTHLKATGGIVRRARVPRTLAAGQGKYDVSKVLVLPTMEIATKVPALPEPQAA